MRIPPDPRPSRPRGKAGADYDLELSDAPPDARHTAIRDEAKPVEILWAWLEGDRAAVDALDWGPLEQP
ncbi:hypothetical protein [Nocardia rosealba]|uniref:hypothetical protein n=1 Tax=Nocardia rosealba TaxID=2878563 RepID=UPI001CD9C2AF|nr:hypothetical protein [Nocardia rosealba]MCA2207308.1 hypothetical protein [Nocardia rosealba]